MKDELNSVRFKGYIQVRGLVNYFTNFFSVTKFWRLEKEIKVIDQIRMVYDTTKSGLNNTVWDPWFSLSTIDSKLRSV